jgi:hypothetical protein
VIDPDAKKDRQLEIILKAIKTKGGDPVDIKGFKKDQVSLRKLFDG